VLDPATGLVASYRRDPATPRSLSGSLVMAIHVDLSGRGWIGTERGIDIIDSRDEQFMAYRRYARGRLPFEDGNIRAIEEDRAGIIWIGTAGDGLMSFDRRTGESHRYAGSASTSMFVNAIHEDRAGTLWIGTRSGLMRLDRARGRMVFAGTPHGIPDTLYANIWAIEEDRAGMLWVGGVFGLMVIDPVRWTGRMFRNDPADEGSLAYNSVWAIHEDREGELWIGTPGGLQRYDRGRGKFVRYQHDPANPASLAHNEVWSIFEDHAGTLWLGTWGGGLNRFDRRRGTFEHFTEEDGLPSNVIHGVLEDEGGFLWVSGGRGLSRFDPRTRTVANFDVNDGLRNDEFNAHAALRARDGEMFFAGSNGLNSFTPISVIPAQTHNAPMVITSFRKLDSLVATELFDGAVVEVLPNENYFSFEFALLDYSRSEKKRYAYRMEGLDNDWVYSGTRRSAAYTNLEPGEYLFRVRGVSGYGAWSRREIAVTIRVMPAFWQTVRFRALAVVGVVAIGLFLNGSRRRRRREREMALEQAREVERRGIADELHDGPLQDLYSTRFVLASLLESASGEGSRAAELEETLRRVRGSLRNICGTLQLPSFDLGLGAAIEGHLERFREIYPGLTVDLALTGREDLLPTAARENLFRVYRSAMSNVVKHAAATRIEVHLEMGRRHALLTVVDNGRGFIPPDSFADLLREQHYGLLLAESHMRAIGGRLDIRSSPGRGTTVLAMLELRRRPPLLVERLKRAALRYRNIHVTQSNENRA
jgi:signal transduction histidine kinase/streptogramin lyase